MALAIPYRSFTKFQLTDKDGKLTESGLLLLNLHLKQLTEAVNFLLGNHGNIELQNVLDMGGFTIVNVGPNKQTLG